MRSGLVKSGDIVKIKRNEVAFMDILPLFTSDN